MVGECYAYGVGHGILLIPIRLLIGFIGLYNIGLKSQPRAYVLLFGLLCLTMA